MKKGYWMQFIKNRKSENIKKYARKLTPAIKKYNGVFLLEEVNTKH